MPKCDIIVPVYNAYDCVTSCIESVLRGTDFKSAHLILIDDKSPDERIVPLLEKYAKENPKEITFLKNEKNLGFVRTVNKGMKYSKDDVLLLNSDTEVPEGWLDRIKECAYSDETIATVTPLSNNATLASVPRIFWRNEMPEGYDLVRMDNLVKKYSMKNYPEIPTAHGFCMYIKRQALDEVGYFDEENFGKGYGEENDFSFRCFELGYRNVLCDDVYVLHKESQSFLDDKVDNGAALEKKHPELKKGLDEWCKARDMRRIGDNIGLALGVQEDRPNILVLIHDFSDFENNVGGTTLHVLDIIRNLRGKYNFHVLAPEGNLYKLHSFFRDTDVESAVYARPILIEKLGLRSNEYAKMVEKIIAEYKISFAHIHHMIGHFFDIGDVCKKKDVDYAVSLHDMYLKTPVISMLDERIGNDLELPVKLEVWREECSKLLSGAKEVIAPSEFAKNVYAEVYKGCKIRVIEHGVDVPRVTAEACLGEKNNIAFVGAIFPHKGSAILEELVGKVKSGDMLKVHLFGMTTAGITKKKVFVNHGAYKRTELGELLRKNKINLVCVFSLAPETFAYTVNEVIAAGVPVLTFDIGASAERVEENGLGWVMKYTDDGGKIYDKIKAILKNKKKYQETIDNINKYSIVNTKEMSLKYGKIYDKSVSVARLDFGVLQRNMLEADLVRNVIIRYGGNNYADDYFAVINSRKWRVVSKIKVPKGVKKIVKNTYKLVKG